MARRGPPNDGPAAPQQLYGRTVLRMGVRLASNAAEFSICPRSAAHAAEFFHDYTMVVGNRTRGDFNRAWAHAMLDEWFDAQRPPDSEGPALA